MATPKLTLSEAIERFWARVQKSDGCWIRATGRHQYGEVTLDGKRIGAHRFSWLIHFGPIPAGMHVLHRCDNPPCVRPDHLFLGTNLDNIADKCSKRRQRGGVTTASAVKGERHWMTRMTADDIKELRAAHRDGLNQYELARRYGVSQSTVWRILHARTWAHVD